ncbi:putative entry exclusion protein TrbK-alt [Aestuariibius insulae]|uniref:putative entry exclusion protein TrbK-alt n=1 Tax=Aestuariibius insulae TaxID=2058287 RepID=UPI00345EBC18
MSRTLKQIAAIGLAAALTAASVVVWRGGSAGPSDRLLSEVRPGSPGVEAGREEARRAELRRCRDLVDAALEDADCLALWAETRRRFLGIAERETERAPTPALPTPIPEPEG